MIIVEDLKDIYKRTIEILHKESLWKINYETLYVDYVVYSKGDNKFLAIGWQWDNQGDDYTKCIKITKNHITDYYHSYEKYSTKDTNIFSHEVDPITLEPICEYRITYDGVHKYSMNGETLQTNLELHSSNMTVEDILRNTNLMVYRPDVLLVSKKPYGDIVYIDVKDRIKELHYAIKNRSNK